MTPDVNVLVAAFRDDHPHHASALACLESAVEARQQGQRLVMLPMVASGFLRLVTHPRVFLEPTPVDQAVAFLETMLTQPGVEMLQVGQEWPAASEMCVERQAVGNDVPDVWIAAAVKYHREHLVTFDRGFRRYLRPRELTVL